MQDEGCGRAASVSEGWNLVGSISATLPAGAITSEPPGLVTSNFFGFEGMYTTSDSVKPGKAYWVHVNENGKLILTAEPTPGNTTPFSSDGMGISQRIKIIETGELPPPPPGESGTPILNPLPTKSGPIPKEFALGQNYPNPFNPLTVIRYQLPVNSYVELKVYSILGQELITVIQAMQDAGYKSVSFDASCLSSGIYFYRLRAGTYSAVKKMLVIK